MKKIYYYDPKKPSPVPWMVGKVGAVELPVEPEDLKSAEDVRSVTPFLPSRAFSIQVENLSFRKVSKIIEIKCNILLHWNMESLELFSYLLLFCFSFKYNL